MGDTAVVGREPESTSSSASACRPEPRCWACRWAQILQKVGQKGQSLAQGFRRLSSSSRAGKSRLGEMERPLTFCPQLVQAPQLSTACFSFPDTQQGRGMGFWPQVPVRVLVALGQRPKGHGMSTGHTWR